MTGRPTLRVEEEACSSSGPEMSREEMMKFGHSTDLFTKSKRYLAGGVSSALRSASKPVPLFFDSASGCRLTDVDGNQYIDYTLAWGPLILGYSHYAIGNAVRKQLEKFWLLGAQHALESSVSDRICHVVPCAEMVAFSNTGTEAVQIAFRLARAFTGRQKVIRFEGHYHGWLDNVVSTGYRAQKSGRSGGKGEASEGLSARAGEEMIVLPWNDRDAVEETLDKRANEIAAIITEPILCNSGCLMPTAGYLQALRDIANRYSIVLIFDEVITGFRVALGGAQELFSVTPDLATFGKALAGGFPLSVVAGKREIMNLISEHRVLHAGTFNGNPISLAAACATLETLDSKQGKTLEEIRKTGETLMAGIKRLAGETGIPLLINGVGSAFHVAFTTRSEMRNAQDTLDCDSEASDCFIQAMLTEGVYLLPDGRWYVSAAHTESDIRDTLNAVRRVFVEQDCLRR